MDAHASEEKRLSRTNKTCSGHEDRWGRGRRKKSRRRRSTLTGPRLLCRLVYFYCALDQKRETTITGYIPETGTYAFQRVTVTYHFRRKGNSPFNEVFQDHVLVNQSIYQDL